MDDHDVDVKSFSSQRWTSLCPLTGRRSAMGRVGLHVETQILSPHDGVLQMQQTFFLAGENLAMLRVRPLTRLRCLATRSQTLTYQKAVFLPQGEVR